MKVRSHITLLVTAVLLPVVIFSTVVLHMMLTAERTAALRSMQELARASVNVMDREMTFAMATAQTLSTSRNLNEGNLEAFYAQAENANRNHQIHAALIDADGRQLFNTIRPYGTPIAPPVDVTRDRIRKVIQGGQPVFSDLIKGRATGQFVVSVEFPVKIRDGRSVVINEWMFAGHLNTLLPIKHIPATWLISVFDRQGITIARNINPEKYVGLPPRPERRQTILAGFEGISRAYTRDGVEMYGAWERSALTGWAVGVGVPVAEVERTAVQSVALSVAGFLIAIVFAIGGAVLFSRRLVTAIDHASAAADALAHHRVPAMAAVQVDEMQQLQAAMHETGRMLVAGEATRQAILREAEEARARAEQAQKVAEDQNRAKDEFLAMLGHELRNPLAAIASGVAMLNLPGTEGERATKVKAIIERQTRHLGRLVDDLLDAHRILHRKITLARVPLDLKAAVEACLSSFEARGAMRTHRIAVELQPAVILADPTRLEQMLTNLVDNAVKYTPDGGSIRVTLRVEGDEAVLAVADTGIGLAPELLSKAFDVFVQGKVVNRSKGGLGIGLAVVNALAQQHDAVLAAESVGLNQGSVFTLRFPVVQAAPDADARRATIDMAGRARVLVIEDNRDVREMLCLMLAEQGMAVQAAGNGRDGIAQARADLPDVALVDIDLPDMSGHDIAALLKGDGATAGIRLIAVTGYGQAMDREKALAAGFDAHFTKPVPVEDLMAAIGRGMQGQR
jgi:signal transduction histidine kinase/ActR/RegA family two-component response regulator